MESEKPFRAEKATSPNPLKLFFEERIFPHLSQLDKEDAAILHGLKFGKEQLQEEYDKFLKYDPSTDRGRNFFDSVLMPFYMISSADDDQSFKDMKALFMEKAKVVAEILYRDAFFRNRYDTLEAWQSCARYKDRQSLLTSLNVLPGGAAERVASMSTELDELWSQEEVERAIENEIADGYVEGGVGEGSMLVQMFREKSEPIPEAKYGGFHELRPDLFPEKYEDYLKGLEDRRHPYRLKL